MKLENFIKIQKFISNSNKSLNPEIPWEGSGITNSLNEIGFAGFLFKMFMIFCVPSFTLSYFFFHDIIELYGVILIGIFGSYIVWSIFIILNEIVIRILKGMIKQTETGILGFSGFMILLLSFVLQYKSSCP
jgi:cellulose synthase/poly-beta-1,6-N-acetylglucosamine synthase-like glycosyltransferase